MNTIFDQYGVAIMKDNKLSDEEIKALFLLLSKIDPDSIDMAISWSSATAEDDGIAFYTYAIQNFFAIHTGNLVAKHFGDQISGMCQEADHSEFDNLPFVKIIKEMAEKMDVERIKSQKPASSIIVINP